MGIICYLIPSIANSSECYTGPSDWKSFTININRIYEEGGDTYREIEDADVEEAKTGPVTAPGDECCECPCPKIIPMKKSTSRFYSLSKATGFDSDGNPIIWTNIESSVENVIYDTTCCPCVPTATV